MRFTTVLLLTIISTLIAFVVAVVPCAADGAEMNLCKLSIDPTNTNVWFGFFQGMWWGIGVTAGIFLVFWILVQQVFSTTTVRNN